MVCDTDGCPARALVTVVLDVREDDPHYLQLCGHDYLAARVRLTDKGWRIIEDHRERGQRPEFGYEPVGRSSNANPAVNLSLTAEASSDGGPPDQNPPRTDPESCST